MHLQLGAVHTEKNECNANTLSSLSLTVNGGGKRECESFVLLRSRVSVTMPLQALDFRWR